MIYKQTSSTLKEEKYRVSKNANKSNVPVGTRFANVTPKISIIIPTLNESKNIKATLASTQISTNIEVIVVDGGSQDNTIDIVQSLGIKVITGYQNRACQMNAGAMNATGDILLFLHADTLLPPNFDAMIRIGLQQPKTVAGAFSLRINAPQTGLRLVEWGVKFRSKWLQMPYGDQGIFITKKIFNDIGGFPELPIMEDFELVRSLKRLGGINLIPVPVITSPRRWLKKGVWQTTLINQIVIIAYFLGVSPNRIRSWYRGEKLIKH
ncbi:TIGR04283 family arsenosugar biosynthesis glycosyltransferase [Plectonema cf. radiosum LEGE 06105]|uniref:4,4'-diaponeurosporenoate glycosyltransferase n=1 Tax=Plectonema cf. radiosum LEGE 06105 TaxID=945769 RepID=A0A8J7F7G9_9CYAN|nr:TIGR04283 family arsenosugar biosynthesis glycosyltransferase [Plectonema radiosum]MBE9216168.1 TIGR04283 family arsenosugar biosynthesis glycosyltransferase [Plectonema cf. radiosum LEGE 06105]